MKATLFAAVLSLFVLSVPTHAIADNAPISVAPVETPVAIKINLNQADVQTLTGSFKGIGRKRAEAIVSYRDAHEGFKTVADLAQVRGLGQSFVNNHLAELERVFSVG